VDGGRIGAPSLTGRLASVSADGKTLRLQLAPKSRDEVHQTTDIRLDEHTTVLFSNVTKGQTKPAEGWQAEIWLKHASKDTAGKVNFIGAAEKHERGEPMPKPDIAGRVDTVAKDGKLVSFLTPPAERGGEPGKADVKLTDKTQMIYYQVRGGGDQPTEGYMARVWLAEGSKDTAAKIVFQAPPKDEGLRGRVTAIAKDGKGITIETVLRGRGLEEGPTIKQVKFIATTRLVFNGIGPDGAVLAEGMLAHVVLVEGTTDTAAVAAFSPAPPAAPPRESR
jgi:hypothetical protein